MTTPWPGQDEVKRTSAFRPTERVDPAAARPVIITDRSARAAQPRIGTTSGAPPRGCGNTSTGCR
ncbi:hypothetical protein ACQEVM_27715 [Streptomyces sp. CA-243310]|uniref:hypothetical protein n=1 Tax=Streptomyces sp. CA-243310 TaxID=3240056 RepID=UPI003D910916